MRLSLLSVLIAALLASCVSSRLADEPADLTAPGRNISSLISLGWEISPPVLPTSVERSPTAESSSDGQSWGAFLGKLAPGDDLRPVRNNAGRGYAIFRGGALVELYLVTIF
jgi:hypothetical protein